MTTDCAADCRLRVGSSRTSFKELARMMTDGAADSRLCGLSCIQVMLSTIQVTLKQ